MSEPGFGGFKVFLGGHFQKALTTKDTKVHEGTRRYTKESFETHGFVVHAFMIQSSRTARVEAGSFPIRDRKPSFLAIFFMAKLSARISAST